MKRLIGILVAGVTLVLAASAFASPQAASGCVEGLKKINGVNARTFCGPAKATVRVNGRTIVYKNGNCSKSFVGFEVNIGTVVLGNVKLKPEYFGLIAKAKAGTHGDGSLAVNHAGKDVAILKATITLKPGLKAGTFSGKVFGSTARITGSFTC
jgi:hypothetical protein